MRMDVARERANAWCQCSAMLPWASACATQVSYNIGFWGMEARSGGNLLFPRSNGGNADAGGGSVVLGQDGRTGADATEPRLDAPEAGSALPAVNGHERGICPPE
jgi:hypothetical protein